MKSLLKQMAIVGLMGSVMSLPVQAAVPTDASLKQLMKVTKTTELMNQMTSPDNTMMDQMVQSSLANIPQDKMSTYQRQKLTKIISKYNKEMFDSTYINKLNQQMMSAYINSAKEHFTQEEVDAQIAFYSSKVGQSIIDKQPAMMQDYMQEAMPIVMESSMTQLQKVMPRMQAEIEALGIED